MTVAIKTTFLGYLCKVLIILETAFILLSKIIIDNHFVSSNEQLGTAQYDLI